MGRARLGIKMTPIKIARTIVGTVRKKIYRQLKISMTKPPKVGPIAGAKTMPMLNKPMAVPRRSGGKTRNMTDIANG